MEFIIKALKISAAILILMLIISTIVFLWCADIYTFTALLDLLLAVSKVTIAGIVILGASVGFVIFLINTLD